MDMSAPALFIGLEQSAFAAAIRQSSWAYALANTLHVVGLAGFAGAVTVLDLRLMGAFGATRPADVVGPARHAAMLGFLLMLASGFVLFAAEASYVVLNPVFQTKAALIAVALTNALSNGRRAMHVAGGLAAGDPMPASVRRAAALSIGLWLAVAASGRLIAYV